MKRTMLSFALAVLPLILWAQQDPTKADPNETDFFGADAPTIADTKPSTADPTQQFNEQVGGAKWGATALSDAHLEPRVGWRLARQPVGELERQPVVRPCWRRRLWTAGPERICGSDSLFRRRRPSTTALRS